LAWWADRFAASTDRIADVSPIPEQPHPVTVEERLFSLVLALIATQVGLTKNDILSTVQGYRQRFQVGGDNASLERQFERDKDDIRELGIPLETIDSPDDPGSNHHLRYRIPKGLYDLPADISFSPDEIMLLKLAAAVWREGSLSAESRRALTKLNSLGIESTDPVIGYAPSLRAREAAFEPLSKAMDRGQVVAFLYLKPGDRDARRRTVAPLAVVLHEGRWHLYGTDQDAGATRTFLLSRIVGPVVTVAGASAPAADDGQGQLALAELDALWQSQIAQIAVEPGTDAAVRLSKRGTQLSGGIAGTMELHYTDINVLADELAGYGPEVLVETPSALRDAVLARLLRVRDSHASPLAGSGEESIVSGAQGDSR